MGFLRTNLQDNELCMRHVSIDIEQQGTKREWLRPDLLDFVRESDYVIPDIEYIVGRLEHVVTIKVKERSRYRVHVGLLFMAASNTLYSGD
jgi:hypothetical protein